MFPIIFKNQLANSSSQHRFLTVTPPPFLPKAVQNNSMKKYKKTAKEPPPLLSSSRNNLALVNPDLYRYQAILRVKIKAHGDTTLHEFETRGQKDRQAFRVFRKLPSEI